MLDIFRAKLAKEAAAQPALARRVEIIHGNMADFDIGRKFALITAPFRAFQAITEEADAEGTLSCVHSHLADGGIFIVNVFYPNADPLTHSWRREEEFIGEITDEETGIRIARYECREKIDPASQIIYPYMAYHVTYPDGRTERLVEHIQMKYYYRHQLRALVEKDGFEITDEFSWYDKASRVCGLSGTQPKHEDVRDANHPTSRITGREIILVCRRKD